MKNLIEVCKKYDITINDTSNKSYIMLIKNDEIIALLKANDKESYLFYKLDLFKNFGKLEINSVAKTKEEIEVTLFNILSTKKQVVLEANILDIFKNIKKDIKFSYSKFIENIKKDLIVLNIGYTQFEKIKVYNRKNNIKDVSMKFYFSKRNFIEDKNYINIVFNIEALVTGDYNGFISSCRIDLSNEEIPNFKTYESMLSKCFLNNKQNIENFVEVYSKTNINFKF